MHRVLKHRRVTLWNPFSSSRKFTDCPVRSPSLKSLWLSVSPPLDAIIHRCSACRIFSFALSRGPPIITSVGHAPPRSHRLPNHMLACFILFCRSSSFNCVADASHQHSSHQSFRSRVMKPAVGLPRSNILCCSHSPAFQLTMVRRDCVVSAASAACR